MTDIERIATLERMVAEQQTRIATLTARDERREAEHVSLLARFTDGHEAQRTEAAETMELFKRFWDERIGGWAHRLATGGDGEPMGEDLQRIYEGLIWLGKEQTALNQRVHGLEALLNQLIDTLSGTKAA